MNDREARRLIVGVVATLLGGIFWGFSGTSASYLFAHYQIDTIWLLSIRQLLAGAMFMVVIVLFDRARFIQLLKNPRHLATMAVFTAFGVFGNSFSYLLAIRLTNAGTATVMQCLQLVLAVGLISAIGAACMSIVPTKILPIYGSSIVTGSAMFVSGLVISAFVRPWESVPAFDASGLIALAILLVVGSFLAYNLYMQGVKDIGSVRASLIGTVEPVSATVTSALVLGTVFAPTDLIGFALIIAMVFLTV